MGTLLRVSQGQKEGVGRAAFFGAGCGKNPFPSSFSLLFTSISYHCRTEVFMSVPAITQGLASALKRLPMFILMLFTWPSPAIDS